MFLDKTVKNVKGYIKVKICGFFVERFLNLALNNAINLWDIRRNSNLEATAYLNIYDYKNVMTIAKKTGCRIEIIEKGGIPFFIQKHKKRKTFAIFFVLIVLLVYIYNQYIWDIDISGDFSFSIEDIKEELEMENIKRGILKKNIDVDIAKNNIYMRRHDIAWIGINFKGTVAKIEIKEGKLKKKEELDSIPCNIISNKEGMVCKINVLEGTKIVNSGDMINSGDILVSGIVSSDWSTDRYVNAKGEIFVKTWYTDRIKIPYERNLISKTGNVEKTYILGIKNYRINLLNSDTKFEKYDKIISNNKLLLFGKFEVPIEFTEIVYQEVKVDTIKYTKEQAILYAKKEIEKNIIKKVDSNAEIVNKQIKTEIDDDGVVIIFTIECIEKTGIKQRLEGF